VKASLPREEQTGPAKSWWTDPAIFALVAKEVVPVAGVLVAGWDVVPVVLMFWLEILVLYLALVLIVALPMLPDPSERAPVSVYLKAGAFSLARTGFGFLWATCAFLFWGGWTGPAVVAELLNKDSGGARAGVSWNPVDVIEGVGKLATQDLSLGAGMVLLAGTYAFEAVAIIRRAKRPQPPASYALFLVTEAPWSVWDVFLPRLTKLGLFYFLMWIVFGVATTIREAPEAAGWFLALVVALKLAFDVSNYIHERTREDKRAASLARFNARLGFDVSNDIHERTHEDKRAASLARFTARLGRGDPRQ
jgi:hypothetical protein